MEKVFARLNVDNVCFVGWKNGYYPTKIEKCEYSRGKND